MHLNIKRFLFITKHKMGNKNRISRMKPVIARKLIVKDSPGKGLGVFAISPIKAGTLVAVYPNVPYQDTDDNTYALTLHSTNACVTGRPWIGKVPSQPLALGTDIAHLFNDACRIPTYERWPGLDKVCSDEQNYYEQFHKNNVDNISGGREFNVTRDISAGEELLYCYGTAYWLGRALPESDKIYKTVYRKILNIAEKWNEHVGRTHVTHPPNFRHLYCQGALVAKTTPYCRYQVSESVMTQLSECLDIIDNVLQTCAEDDAIAKLRTADKEFDRLQHYIAMMPRTTEEDMMKLSKSTFFQTFLKLYE